MEEKKYKVYLLIFYDENIEEYNTCGLALSKKHSDSVTKSGEISIESLNITKDKILECVWDKEDVDFFVEEYPDSSEWTFKVYTELSMNWFQNVANQSYILYDPISKRRDYKISIITK